MASLSLSKWARYEPSIPENLELPVGERFFLELHAGMSSIQFGAFVETLKGVDDEASMAAALSPAMRMGSVPLTLDDVAVESVAEYIMLVAGQRGRPLLTELQEKLVWLNSYGGTREVFCVRPSGGSAFTVDQKSAEQKGVE